MMTMYPVSSGFTLSVYNNARSPCQRDTVLYAEWLSGTGSNADITYRCFGDAGSSFNPGPGYRPG